MKNIVARPQLLCLLLFRIAVKMAVARPIRMLGAASIILCLFLIFQLNKGPTTLLGSQGKLSSMKADPLLQRALVLLACCVWVRCDFCWVLTGCALIRYWGARRSIMAGVRQRLLPRQRQLCAYGCCPHFPGTKRRTGRFDPEYAGLGAHVE